MVDCAACGKPLAPPTVRCSSCGVEIHRACGKCAVGKWYCKSCYKRSKKQIKFEQMARRTSVFGTKRPGKIW